MKKIFGTISICLTLLALIFGAPGTTATYAAAAPADPALSQKTSPEGLLNPDGTLNLDASFHGTLDLAGWNVQIDPQRGPVFAPEAAIAPGTWAGLGVGASGSMNNVVFTIVVNGTDVYVGGNFTDLNNGWAVLPAADYIAKWNGSSWSALGSNGAGDGSLNYPVLAIAVSGTDVYVGGVFTNVNNNGNILTAADYIAKWNGSSWSALGSNGAGNSSLESPQLSQWDVNVGQIVVIGTDVYVGGHFTDVNNNGTILTAADYIAKWNGSSWSALGSNGAGNGSLDESVSALAVIGTNLYVGGYFTNVNNSGTILPAADYIAKWNGSAWSALGSNGIGNGSLNYNVNSIAVSGTSLYVGGYFTNVNNSGAILPAADYIAKWNGSAWSALGSNGAGNGAITGNIFKVTVSGTDVYVGGYFTNVNNNGTVLPAADYVAKWNGSAWSALGSNGTNGDGSLNQFVYAIAVSGTNVYVGGAFNNIKKNGVALAALDYIATWNGTAWSAFGNISVDGVFGSGISAIAVSGTDVYVGGTFRDANKNGVIMPTVDYIAKWNGSVWSALGSNGAGNGSLNARVHTIAVSGTNLYVGGGFTNVNNNGKVLPAADYIAKWDTLTGNWSALGSNGAGDGSINYPVSAIAISGTNLYAGGIFTDVNNKGTILPAADLIAKWDILTGNWSALGSNGAGDGSLRSRADVYAVAVSGTDVYVGGDFDDVNNNGTILTAADKIVKWNGTNWSALGSNGAGDGSIAGEVNVIAVSGTNVYVGGYFRDVNDKGTVLPAADYIAKWNGTNWSALGSNGASDGSLNNAVYAIAVNGTNVYVGGDFLNVKNNGTTLTAADYIAKWNGVAWSALGSNGTGNGSLNASVGHITISGTNVYVSGSFTNVNNNGVILRTADHIAVYGLGAAPTPTPTTIRTQTMTRTPTRTATPIGTSTVTPTIPATPTVTVTVTTTQTIDVSPTATATPSPVVTITETSTETMTVTPTETPTETMTPTPTIEITPTFTITPTATAT